MEISVIVGYDFDSLESGVHNDFIGSLSSGQMDLYILRLVIIDIDGQQL